MQLHKHISCSSSRASLGASLTLGLVLVAAPLASPASPAWAQDALPTQDVAAAGRSAVVVSQRGQQMGLSIGADDGVRVGQIYTVERQDRLAPGSVGALRVRIVEVSPKRSRAQWLEADPLGINAFTVGDTLRLVLAPGESAASTSAAPADAASTSQAPSSASNGLGGAAADASTDASDASIVPPAGSEAGSMARSARPAPPQRANQKGDYIAAAAALALVLSAPSSPSKNFDRAFVGDQQFSAISPFPGGGYSILPDGRLLPGGAMQVNIPVAYAPRQFSGNVGAYAAQIRQGRSILNGDGRNGTLNTGLGFPVAGRGVWISRMGLSAESLGFGGDSAYNAQIQIVGETSSLPAISVGAQDVTNRRERSPFLVATKQLKSTRPLFASLGLGRGRFSGSTLFGGVSYAPFEKLSLAGEYDGLQINLGASYALTRRLSALVSLNDLSNQKDRPASGQGRRYQVGANYGF